MAGKPKKREKTQEDFHMSSTNVRSSNGLRGKTMRWLKISSIMAAAGAFPLFADTIKIDAGGNIIEVTIREARQTSGGFQHTVTVKNDSNSNLGTAGVSYDGNTGNVSLSGGASRQYSYTTTSNDQGTTGTVSVTIGSTTYTGTAAVQPTPSAKETQKGIKALSIGEVEYDPSTEQLSFPNDVISSTGSPGDPVVGAQVDAPTFTFAGLTTDSSMAIFSANSGGFFSIQDASNTYLEGNTDYLMYDIATNQFFGDLFTPFGPSVAGAPPSSPLFDPSLPNVSSPFLQGLENILDPASANFDPAASAYFVFQPDQNIFTQSAGFTQPASGTITDQLYAGDPAPEPATFTLLGCGFLALFIYYRRRRNALTHG
jgi:hypothetical protein